MRGGFEKFFLLFSQVRSLASFGYTYFMTKEAETIKCVPFLAQAA